MMLQLGCADYHFSHCPAKGSCDMYVSCTACIADPFCGWCASTNKCAEGVSDGVIANLGNIGCGVGYAFGPSMPSSDDLSFAAIVASSDAILKDQRRKHGHICERADAEAKEHLMKIIDTQTKVNRTLENLMVRCAPCNGVWPQCDCDGNVDYTYHPGQVSVQWKVDEATSASHVGMDSNAPPTPEETALSACEKVKNEASAKVVRITNDYLQKLKQSNALKTIQTEDNYAASVERELRDLKNKLDEANLKADAAAEACESFKPGPTKEDIVAARTRVENIAAKLRDSLQSGNVVDIEGNKALLSNATTELDNVESAVNTSVASKKVNESTENSPASEEKGRVAVGNESDFRFRGASVLLRKNGG